MEVESVGDGGEQEGQDGGHRHHGQTDVVQLQNSGQFEPDKKLTENSGKKSAEEQGCSDEAGDGLVMFSRNPGVDIGEVGHLGGGGNAVGNLNIYKIYNLRQFIFVSD